MQNLLEELNSKQKEAVENTDGPCLVIAGAGSGKTKVLTYKIAYLIQEKNIKPWNILAITFTNKAANEMRNRAEALIGENINDLWLGTFHSVCVRILRKFIDRLGFDTSFAIFDTSDQKTLIKNCLKDLNVDTKMFTEKAVLNEISNAKNEMIEPEAYNQEYAGDYRKGIIGKVFSLYQKRLKENNAIDFDDIINFTIKIFMENPDVLEYYSNKFKYILVDEYQDTNKAQFTLITLLASKYGNITVVGDNDQGIYSFRGADISNILNFEKDFPGTKIIKLEQNYRCTGNILKIANAVIKNNENKYDKKLWTENEEGALPYIFCGEDEYGESNFIIEQINKLRMEGHDKYSDFAILYRMNSQSRAIEDKLRIENIPYKIIGGLKFYERKEIKDTIAYLRLLANQSDNLSLERIINEPKRGVGKTSLDNAKEISEQQGISMYEVIKRADEFIPRIYNNTREFVNAIEELKNREIPIADLITEVLNRTGYIKSLEDEKTVEAESRLENIEEFLTVANEFEKEAVDKSLVEFLNSISLASDTDNLTDTDDMVTLMTLHSAKGLEYPVIFLVGLEEGIFPGYQSMDSPSDIEEERRLFYVGITRAKKNLFLSLARRRTIFGSTSYNPPSRFIKEVPKALLDGYDEAIKEQTGTEEYEDSNSSWEYGKGRKWGNKYSGDNIVTYKVDKGFDNAIKDSMGKINSNIEKTNKSSYGTKFGISAEGFLASLQTKKSEPLDLSKYKVGQRVYHKKFGEGIISKLEEEGEDIKVDIDFEKVGHKRLMARFAGLEVLQ